MQSFTFEYRGEPAEAQSIPVSLWLKFLSAIVTLGAASYIALFRAFED